MQKSLYTKYINEVFHAINGLLPTDRNPEVAFGEGTVSNAFSGSNRDYAIIRNENAVMFADLIREYSGLFQINPKTITLQRSRIDQNEVKYRHSCYPRNIHRWLNGTISRKKLYRIEWIVMAYCWASGWNGSERSAKRDAVIKELRGIALRYCDHISKADPLLVCLWEACEHAYRHSIE